MNISLMLSFWITTGSSLTTSQSKWPSNVMATSERTSAIVTLLIKKLFTSITYLYYRRSLTRTPRNRCVMCLTVSLISPSRNRNSRLSLRKKESKTLKKPLGTNGIPKASGKHVLWTLTTGLTQMLKTRTEKTSTKHSTIQRSVVLNTRVRAVSLTWSMVRSLVKIHITLFNRTRTLSSPSTSRTRKKRFKHCSYSIKGSSSDMTNFWATEMALNCN